MATPFHKKLEPYEDQKDSHKRHDIKCAMNRLDKSFSLTSTKVL